MKLKPPFDIEDLVDYWKDESFKGKLEHATHVGRVSKDGFHYVDLFLVVKDGKFVEAKYDANGSVLSGGLAAVLCDSLIGKSITDIPKLNPLNLVTEQIPPGRLACANLPYFALQVAFNGQKENPPTQRTRSEDSG